MNLHDLSISAGLLLGTLAIACCSSPDASIAELHSTAPVADPDAGSVALADTPPAPRAQTVGRSPGTAPHEVELDPRGEVAVTVDELGRVWLWPAIRSGDPAKTLPFELPIHEPMAVSIAQAERDGYVVTQIDTANTGQVLAVQPSADGQTATVTELFTLAPDDPLLELHALDGGQRFLALGVDHRIRLYDRAGALLSVIDQRGFLPWQLRVVHAGPGEPPKLAAILAPSKVQRIALVDDRLSLVGEAQQVALDRGPNRNDLLLSPDGKTVATLRRRSGSTRAFTIQLIDLETNGRRLIGGDTATTIRPRMHFVDADTILLESGNPWGHGLWLELANATALTDIADADPESKLATQLAKVKHPTIPLVASAERKPEWFDPEFDDDWDRGERLHASVVNGIRVNVERGGRASDTLIIDPLASDRHFAISTATPEQRQRTLDWTGRRHAAVTGETLWIAEFGPNPGPRVEIAHGLGEPRLLAFVDEVRIVLVDDRGALALFDASTGARVAESKLELSGGLDTIAFVADDSGGGLLGWRGRRRSDPIQVVSIRGGVLGEPTTLADEQGPRWLHVREPGDAELGVLLGLSADDVDELVDEVASAGADKPWFYTRKDPRTSLWVVDGDDRRTLRLPAGQARELRVSPDASKIAVVQFRERDDDSFVEDHLLTVLDVTTGARLWTIGAAGTMAAPIWSGDGLRILAHGEVRDAATGEPVSTPSSSALVIADRADSDHAREPEE